MSVGGEREYCRPIWIAVFIAYWVNWFWINEHSCAADDYVLLYCCCWFIGGASINCEVPIGQVWSRAISCLFLWLHGWMGGWMDGLWLSLHLRITRLLQCWPGKECGYPSDYTILILLKSCCLSVCNCSLVVRVSQECTKTIHSGLWRWSQLATRNEMEFRKFE